MIRKLLKAIQNKHILSLAGNMVMAVFGFFTYMLLYRYLSKEELGNWVFFQMVFILVDTFRTGFMQTAFIKFYAGAEPDRAKTVAGSTWYLSIVITLVFIVINIPALFIMPYFNDIGILLFLKWFGLAFLVTLPFNVSSWILQAEHRFDTILYIRIINQGSFILMVIALILTNNISLYTILYSFLISSSLASAVCLLVGWAKLGTLKKKQGACVSELYHFGKYSVGTVVSSSLLKSSDTFIIKFMLGPVALAIYNVPQRLMEVIEIPIRSFLATAMPEMSHEFNKGNMAGLTYIMKKYSGMLTIMLVPVSIMAVLLADQAIWLVSGNKYVGTEAANVFRVAILLSVLYPIDRFLGVTLDIIHKPQLNLIKVLLMLATNVIGDILGIWTFGNIYGVAASSIFTSGVGVLYGYVALKKNISFSLGDIFRLGLTETKSLMRNIASKLKTT